MTNINTPSREIPREKSSGIKKQGTKIPKRGKIEEPDSPATRRRKKEIEIILHVVNQVN